MTTTPDKETQQKRETQMISVRALAVDWLKKHYPALCEKSGLCERVAGRLYTRTTLRQRDEPMAEGKAEPIVTIEVVTHASGTRTMGYPDGSFDWSRLPDGRHPLYTTQPLPSLREVRADVPEGCTPADAMVLREANHAFAAEIERLRQALRFYAAQHHLGLSDPNAWDTVSGEGANFWCDEAGTATIEDGWIAKAALRGEHIDWGDDEPPLCDGEPEELHAAELARLGGGK